MKADEPRQNRIPFMMSDVELKAVDDWRFENRIATRAEAIRRLCQMGLIFSSFTEFFGRNGKELADYLHKVDETSPHGDTVHVSRDRLHDLQIFIASAVWAASRGMKFAGPEDLRRLIEGDDRMVRLLTEAGVDVEDEE